MAIDNLEDVSSFTLSDEGLEQLLAAQHQCTVNWTTREGFPMGMPHTFVWSGGRFWVHTSTKRKRVKALADRPQSGIVVSAIGTSLPSSMASARTIATVHHGDRDLVRWILPQFWDRARMTPTDKQSEEQLWRLFDTPARVVIEFDPIDIFTWSSAETASALRRSGFDRWDHDRWQAEQNVHRGDGERTAPHGSGSRPGDSHGPR